MVSTASSLTVESSILADTASSPRTISYSPTQLAHQELFPICRNSFFNKNCFLLVGTASFHRIVHIDSFFTKNCFLLADTASSQRTDSYWSAQLLFLESSIYCRPYSFFTKNYFLMADTASSL